MTWFDWGLFLIAGLLGYGIDGEHGFFIWEVGLFGVQTTIMFVTYFILGLKGRIRIE